MISSLTFFLLVGSKVIGSQHHQTSGSNESGDYVLVSSRLLLFFSHSVISDSLRPNGLQQRQVSLSITNTQSLLKLMSIELVMPSNHLILCRPLLLLPSTFPIIRSFPMSQFFASDGQSIGASVSASVLPRHIQGSFPLGLSGLISLLSKGF